MRLRWLALTALLFLSAPLVWADLFVTIQPIIVCDDAGLNCANSGNQLFELEGDKIWAQAGIDLNFLGFDYFWSTEYLNIGGVGENTFEQLTLEPGHGQNPDPLVINMWFVNEVAGAYGAAWLNYPGIAISDSVFSYNGGLGRIDTIAHEIGHNLGLEHNDAAAFYLMASGGIRQPALTSDDIYPDGLGLDRLTAAEIAIARASYLLDSSVPEPATLGPVALILLLLGGWRSRRFIIVTARNWRRAPGGC